MKCLLFVMSLFLMCGTLHAEGIEFDTQSSWEQIKQRAKEENKYILMDCQTTWCGWCRKMEADVFPDESLGAYVNEHFISVSVQFDKTKSDNDYVKSWYSDAEAIQKNINIPGFPTILIYSPEGEIVHKIVGYQPADEFSSNLQKSLQPDNQFYPLLRKFQAGYRDSLFLKNFIGVAKGADEPSWAHNAFEQYYTLVKDPFKMEDLNLIIENTTSVHDSTYNFLYSNLSRVEQVLGKEVANNSMGMIIYREIAKYRQQSPDLSLDSMGTVYKKKYPKVDFDNKLLYLKIGDAIENKNVENIQNFITKYVESQYEQMSNIQLNYYAFVILENSEDKAYLNKALTWSKKTVSAPNEQSWEYLDTYANLLYKLGAQSEALKWEQIALDLCKDEEMKKDLLETLTKMKNGEKTW